MRGCWALHLVPRQPTLREMTELQKGADGALAQTRWDWEQPPAGHQQTTARPAATSNSTPAGPIADFFARSWHSASILAVPGSAAAEPESGSTVCLISILGDSCLLQHQSRARQIRSASSELLPGHVCQSQHEGHSVSHLASASSHGGTKTTRRVRLAIPEAEAEASLAMHAQPAIWRGLLLCPTTRATPGLDSIPPLRVAWPAGNLLRGQTASGQACHRQIPDVLAPTFVHLKCARTKVQRGPGATRNPSARHFEKEGGVVWGRPRARSLFVML